MLHAVSPTYSIIILLVVIVSIIASAGPALRAASSDPATVLREE